MVSSPCRPAYRGRSTCSLTRCGQGDTRVTIASQTEQGVFTGSDPKRCSQALPGNLIQISWWILRISFEGKYLQAALRHSCSRGCSVRQHLPAALSRGMEREAKEGSERPVSAG